MLLNERKTKILEAIINDYVATAEPIGSRTIVKRYGLGISPATVRNEMSDLEDMGLILQPHMSAGRIPSDKGYRLYVDSLMRYRELTDDEMSFLRGIIERNIRHIDYLMQETAKAISLLTNYTVIVSEPKLKTSKIKHIQLMPFDGENIMVVVITDAKEVKNIALNTGGAAEHAALCALTDLLNERFAQRPIESLSPDDAKGFGEHQRLADAVVAAIIKEFQLTDAQLFTSGVKNILGYPEFSNAELAKDIFQALEEKGPLLTLLCSEGKGGVDILIGNENNIEQMRRCSVIKTAFSVKGARAGGIGIIGPTRMDYSQVASVLSAIVKKINHALNSLSDGG